MSEDVRRLAAGTLMAGFAGSVVPSWVREAAADGLASVCLYGSNAESPQAVSALAHALREVRADLLVATDEEGGDVTRLHYRTGSPQPGAAALGVLDDVALTRECAAAAGAELAAAGIGLNLGPVADINSDPANPVIGTRSFGATASLVSAHVTAWVEAQQAAGVAACVKHFPGHGDTAVDSHRGLPVVSATADLLADRELRPFEAAVRAGVAAVMTAHLVVPALDPAGPATFSRRIVDGVLRDRLGFDGVVVSDALDMEGASGEIGRPEAAVRALLAGCDLLCLGPDLSSEDLDAVLDAVAAAVADGRVTADRLAASASRVRRLAASVPLLPAGAPADAAAGVARLPDPAAFAGAVVGGPRLMDWLAAPGDWVAVRAETGTNPAVGEVPWGLGAVVATVAPDDVRPGERVVVAARDVGAGHPALPLVDRLRAAGHPTLLVEHGWPRPGIAVDVATHGSSPTLARLLLARLDPGRRRP